MLGDRRHTGDTGWKLLAHIRCCLRALPPTALLAVHRAVADATSSRTPKSLFDSILRRLAGWRAGEVTDLNKATLLLDLFEQHAISERVTRVEDILYLLNNRASLNIGKFSVTVVEYGNEGNSLEVGPLSLDLRSGVVERGDGPIGEAIDAAAGGSGRRTTSKGKEPAEPTRPVSSNPDVILAGKLVDVRAAAKIDRVEVDLNPNLFGFVRHALRVSRWFEKKLLARDSSPPVRPSATPGPSATASSSSVAYDPAGTSVLAALRFAFSGSAVVDEVTLTANAHNLAAKAKITGVQVSMVHIGKEKGLSLGVSARESPSKRQQSSSSSDPTPQRLLNTTVGSIVQVRVSIFERRFRNSSGTSPADRTVLIMVDIGGVSGSASISTPLGGAGPADAGLKLSVAAVIRTISLTLPRSLLKLHAFLERWGDEELPRYDFLFNKLVQEWGPDESHASAVGGLAPEAPATPSAPPFASMSFQLLLGDLTIQSDLLATLRFAYEACNLLIVLDQDECRPKAAASGERRSGSSRKTSMAAATDIKTNYSARLGSHLIKFLAHDASAASTAWTAASTDWTQFAMPAVSSQGCILQPAPWALHDSATPPLVTPASRTTRVEATLAVDVIEATLNVSIIDQLITTQSVLGGELNDILDVLTFYSRRRAQGAAAARAVGGASSSADHGARPDMLFLYALKITAQGLRLSFESPDTVTVFESGTFGGFLMNLPKESRRPAPGALPAQNSSVGSAASAIGPKLRWRFAASRFSVGLVDNVATRTQLRPVAYVALDFTMQNYSPGGVGAQDASASLPADEAGRSSNLPRDTSRNSLATGSSSSLLGMVDDDGDDESGTIEAFYVRFHKIHAVLQPMAIGRLMETALYFKSNLEWRSQLKAREMAKIKENTNRFLRGINAPIPDKQKSRSFLDDKMIDIVVTHIGAAIPLQDAQGVIAARSAGTVGGGAADGSRRDAVPPAFVASARSICFSNKRIKTSRGSISDLCVNFVPAFDQGTERHFAQWEVAVDNKILLRDVNATFVQRDGGPGNTVTRFGVDAGIKGFELEVDAGIAGYVNRLGEIIEAGRETIVAAAPLAPPPGSAAASVSPAVSASTASPSASSPATMKDEEPGRVETVRFELDGRFEFQEGVCRIVSGGGKGRGPPFSRQSHRSKPTSVEELSVHALTLPGITLLTKGRTFIGDTPPPECHISAGNDARALHIELVIHPSDNVLHPSILIFFRDVLGNLNVSRKRKALEAGDAGDETPAAPDPSDAHSQPSKAEESAEPESEKDAAAAEAMAAYRRHNITFYLCLLETKVSLSCQPASKVICALYLKEASFFFSFVPKGHPAAGRQFLSCTGNILETSGSLRHAFSPEDCLKGSVRRVTFNITMVEERYDRTYAIELGVPSVEASLNVRHLQDFFLFERMWFSPSIGAGSAPNGDASFRSSAASSSTSLSNIASSQRPSRSLLQLSRVALAKANTFYDSVRAVVRLNEAVLSADLGQAIGKMTITVASIVGSGRASWTPDAFEERVASLAVESIASRGEGRFSGSAAISGIHCAIAGRNARLMPALPDGSHSGTEITIRIDHVGSQLQYQYERILIFEMSPISASVMDRWRFGDAGTKVEIEVEALVESIRLIISRRTLPTFIHMFHRLKAVVEEKRSMEMHMAAGAAAGAGGGTDAALPATGAATVRPTSAAEIPLAATPLLRSAVANALKAGAGGMLPPAPPHGFFNLHGMNVDVSARVRITLSDAFIALTRYNFRDPDCAQILASGIELRYVQRPASRTTGNETISVNLGGFRVRKCTSKPISQTEERTWTSQQWFTFMTASAAKNVAVVPSVVMRMTARTLVLPGDVLDAFARRVEFSFRTDFGGNIDVALNYGLYKYLQDLAALYAKAITTAGELDIDDPAGRVTTGTGAFGPAGPSLAPGLATSSFATSGTAPIPSSAAVSSNIAGSGSSSLRPAPAFPTPSSPSTSPHSAAISSDAASSSTNAAGAELELAFVLVGELVFDPHLKITGDATPWDWVELIGGHKEKVPKLLHQFVTINVRDLHDGIGELYARIFVLPVVAVEGAATFGSEKGKAA
ncbi:hypothetical protein BDK51DRAFT_39419 [Blyttiomyces helicus]|uniref:Uncharacterized protein n=1 Tax=Blyttiomyces helicus TaxID=388810 RepID=A0A4P9WNS1_9FUNG|nr:hypothetical protein BDK51DRAFT_39419 [Blyttiomyces helicus]|eukprot:RKO93348.1 hypothetical protein BDK51DRAFT_39419 [Blyttiomyces helicus]